MEQEERLRNLCDNLRLLRKSHGLTKARMAEILGVGMRTMNALERGIVPRRLGGSVLIRASVYFRVSTEELLLPVEKAGLPG